MVKTMKTVYYRYGNTRSNSKIIKEERGYEYLHNFFGINQDHSKAIEEGCLVITNDMEGVKVSICKNREGLLK